MFYTPTKSKKNFKPFLNCKLYFHKKTQNHLQKTKSFVLFYSRQRAWAANGRLVRNRKANKTSENKLRYFYGPR